MHGRETDLRTEGGDKTVTDVVRASRSELGLRDCLLELLALERAGGLERVNGSLGRRLDVRSRLALDEETEQRRVRVGQEDRPYGRASRDARGDGRGALRPLHGRGRVQMRGKDSELRRGCARRAEADEDGLGAMVRVDARLAAKVARGLGRGRGSTGDLTEGLLEELLERASVDAGAEDGDVARAEDRLRERLDVVRGDVVAGGGEDGVAEAVAERERVRELEGVRRGVVERRGRLGLADGADGLAELVAGELGGGEEGGEDVDEEGPGRAGGRERDDMADAEHSLVAAQELGRQRQVLPRET